MRKKLPFKSRLLFKISGMDDVIKKNRVDCKSNWIKENEPEIWQKDGKVSAVIHLSYL